MKTEDSTATQHDGHLVVRFSENDIEAWADFIPPAGQGKFITSAYLEYLMEELNINYGIQWDDIQEKALLCNTGRQPIQGVLVARGEVPVNEVGEYYDPVPNLINRPAPTKNSEHVDYRNFSPFTIVKKDQVLAVFRPRIEGRDGKDVHSTVLPFKAINHPGVSSGKNTRADDKNIIALIDGQLIEVSRSLNVEENLIVKGSVGYSTGHINFPGDVFIHGLVADGFKIYSGGSVTIKQTYDVTDVMTKGDLTVAGGLIGRGPALVKVGGLLRTKFIENCRVACRKTVSVTTEIVNSSIFAMEKLEMGDKSQILGGDIYAIHGVRTGNIGKKSGRSTQIHCGIDFTVQQEKDKCNNQLRMVDAKLHRLREIMAQSG
ncbi:MAG: FapA family protein, partial [Treponema sp.]|nr:FapA family protein [Treponema sp.]